MNSGQAKWGTALGLNIGIKDPPFGLIIDIKKAWSKGHRAKRKDHSHPESGLSRIQVVKMLDVLVVLFCN